MEIQRASRRSRNLALLILALAALAAVPGYWLAQAWLERVMLLPRPAAISTLLNALLWLAALACAGLLAAGIYFIRLARAVRLAGRFPPPGMQVIRDTPVLRAEAAHRRARWIGRAGWALGVSALALVAVSWHAHSVLSRPVAPDALPPVADSSMR